MAKNSSEAGFAALEIILVVVLVAVIGVLGYQAWQNGHNKATNQTASTTPSLAPTAKYFTIKEWGVKAPYSGTDQLTYTISGNLATIVSKELAAKNAGCATYGAGQVRRLSPTDGAYADGTGPSAENFAKQDPGALTYVNGYYYLYVHDQAVCSTDQAVDAQNQANVATQPLVAHFQASN